MTLPTGNIVVDDENTDGDDNVEEDKAMVEEGEVEEEEDNVGPTITVGIEPVMVCEDGPAIEVVPPTLPNEDAGKLMAIVEALVPAPVLVDGAQVG